MKILLLGEYSGLHNNLKKGLLEFGYQVSIAATGDGFKQLATDIALGGSSPSVWGKVDRIITPFLKLDQLLNFDVVQFINSNPLTIFSGNAFIYKKILNNSGKSFLSACGDDPVFYQNLNKLRYHPYSALNSGELNMEAEATTAQIKNHNIVVNGVDGIIPVLYEYALGYKDNSKTCKTIPIPLFTHEIPYQDNVVKGKIAFFHGLNRPFFKGTAIISEALQRLKSKYPNDVEIDIGENMSLANYLERLKKANVVLDQCKCYSYALNALYAMSLGKVVLSGSEPEALAELNIPENECSVINITPDVDQIYQQLLTIMDKKNEIVDLGFSSRKYVEKYHESVNIAQQYVEAWNSK